MVHQQLDLPQGRISFREEEAALTTGVYTGMASQVFNYKPCLWPNMLPVTQHLCSEMARDTPPTLFLRKSKSWEWIVYGRFRVENILTSDVGLRYVTEWQQYIVHGICVFIYLSVYVVFWCPMCISAICVELIKHQREEQLSFISPSTIFCFLLSELLKCSYILLNFGRNCSQADL